jgi:hypothetical protein
VPLSQHYVPQFDLEVKPQPVLARLCGQKEGTRISTTRDRAGAPGTEVFMAAIR